MELERLKQMSEKEMNWCVGAAVQLQETRPFSTSWAHAMDAAEEAGLFHDHQLWRDQDDGGWIIDRIRDDSAVVCDPSGPRAICMAILILAEEQ